MGQYVARYTGEAIVSATIGTTVETGMAWWSGGETWEKFSVANAFGKDLTVDLATNWGKAGPTKWALQTLVGSAWDSAASDRPLGDIVTHNAIAFGIGNVVEGGLSWAGNAVWKIGMGWADNYASGVAKNLAGDLAAPVRQTGDVVAPSSQGLELSVLNREFVPDTQRILQSLTDRAVADLAANPRLARDLMSPGSYAQLRNGTGLADASYGKAVERLVARYVQEDELLSNILRHTGRSRGPNGQFISSPDFIGKEAYNLRLLDITTSVAIPRHLSRPGFGRSSEFVIHHGKGTTQFP